MAEGRPSVRGLPFDPLPEWHDRSACGPKRAPDWFDNDLMFPNPTHFDAAVHVVDPRVVRLCARCPVKRECRTEGLSDPIPGCVVRGGWVFVGRGTGATGFDAFDLKTKEKVAEMRSRELVWINDDEEDE